MDTRLSTVISHEGYCGLYIQVHVRYSPFPAARPQSNVHTLTHGAAHRRERYSGAILRCFSILREGSFSMCAHTALRSHVRTTSCDYFTFRPALKGNEFANMLIFDPRVLRDSFAFTVHARGFIHFTPFSFQIWWLNCVLLRVSKLQFVPVAIVFFVHSYSFY